MDTSSVDRDAVIAASSGTTTKGQGITITASAADEIRKQAAKR